MAGGEGFSGLARGMFDRRREKRRADPRKQQEAPSPLYRNFKLPLPCSGETAFMTSDAICKRVLPEVLSMHARSCFYMDPPSSITGVHGQEEFGPGQHDLGSRSHFLDLATGIRARYLQWGSGHDITVIALHDVGETSEVWAPMATKLSRKGMIVVAPDLRGHGSTAHSSEGAYTPAALAEDLQSLVVELDLYVRPVAVVGVGLGAAVGAALAARAPALVGCVLLAELSPRGAEEFHSFSYLQAADFGNVEEAAAALGSGRLGHPERPQDRVMKTVRAVVGPDPVADWRVRVRMEPRFFALFAADELIQLLSRVECHTLIVRGSESHVLGREEAEEVARGCKRAASLASLTLKGCSHYLATDHPFPLYQAVHDMVATHEGLLEHRGGDARLPEQLGIRTLPQFDTIEDARKALMPRRVPTRERLREELRRLKVEGGGGDSSDSDWDEPSNATALAKESAEYFGFCG